MCPATLEVQGSYYIETGSATDVLIVVADLIGNFKNARPVPGVRGCSDLGNGNNHFFRSARTNALNDTAPTTTLKREQLIERTPVPWVLFAATTDKPTLQPPSAQSTSLSLV